MAKHLLVDGLATNDGCICVVYREVCQFSVRNVFVYYAFDVFVCDAVQLQLLREVLGEWLLKIVRIDGIYDFRILEEWVCVESFFDVDRGERGHPTVTVDDVGRPPQLLDGLQYASYEEYRTVFIVVEFSVFVGYCEFPLEEIVVVDEIYLHPRGLNGRHFDDQRVVRVINDDVHT